MTREELKERETERIRREKCENEKLKYYMEENERKYNESKGLKLSDVVRERSRGSTKKAARPQVSAESQKKEEKATGQKNACEFEKIVAKKRNDNFVGPRKKAIW